MHGEQNEMGRLKAALIREYEDNPVSSVPVKPFTPVLRQSIISPYLLSYGSLYQLEIEIGGRFYGEPRGVLREYHF